MIVQVVLVTALPLLVAVAAWRGAWRDRWGGEPLVRLVELAGLGAAAMLVVATYGAVFEGTVPEALVGLARRSPSVAHGLAAAVAGAETLALVAVAVLALGAGHLLRTPVDGVVLGALAGAGAGAVRNAVWMLGGWHTDPGWLVFGQLELVAACAVLGAALAWARLTLHLATRLARGLGGFVAAVAAHAVAWAAAAGGGVGWVGAAVAAAALAAAAWGAIVAERRLLAAELRPEVEFGVVPAWIVADVEPFARRWRGTWWPRADERRSMVRLLLELAAEKRRLVRLDAERLRLYGLEVGRLRLRAKAIIPAAPPSALAEDQA